jgi:hypothetical protein
LLPCDGTPGPNGEPSLADLCTNSGGACADRDNDPTTEHCALP